MKNFSRLNLCALLLSLSLSSQIIFSDDVSVTDPDELRKTITGLIGNFVRSVK